MRARLAQAGWDTLVAKIAAREIDPYTAAAELLETGDRRQETGNVRQEM